MRSLILLLVVAAAVRAQSTRELAELNWVEFRELVPSRMRTVLLPTGTLEAHGVINNGADMLAPLALARAMARRVDALVAPGIPYGVTGSLDAYAGGFSISEPAYCAYVSDVLAGLARTGFRNLILINGHGGPQSSILNELAERVGRERGVRTLVVNCWSYCSDVRLRIFGEDGGHAGWNETAMIQAIDPGLVKTGRYADRLALPRPTEGTWAAYPFPATIILYRPGEGYPRSDQAKAKAYFDAVVEKLTALVGDVIARWDGAGVLP
ncbi:MAG: creatininase family protein [Bryobacterales bacterium]|nr:creatininase family protein [Bryobacteraceae bacterium]MDW8129848.1 creatininase family protein [Bryobacterales bacterium]